MSSMIFPGEYQLITVDDAEAEAICLAHCQNTDDCKLGCFGGECPLGSVELQRLNELIKKKPAYNPLIPFSKTMNSVLVLSGRWSSK